MSELPRTFDDTVAQFGTALDRAIQDGRTRLQVDIRVPGLDTLTLLQALAPRLGEGWAACFPDAGAAALARRRLGEVPFDLRGLSEMRRGGDYRAYILVEPSAVEVETVEALAEQIGSRLLILLNSRLEEAGVVGIGLTGRRLRERFLSTLDVIYAIQPCEAGAVYRCWPGAWQIWREGSDGDYSLVTSLDHRPSGEEIDTALRPQGEGLFDSLRRFLRALGS